MMTAGFEPSCSQSLYGKSSGLTAGQRALAGLVVKPLDLTPCIVHVLVMQRERY